MEAVPNVLVWGGESPCAGDGGWSHGKQTDVQTLPSCELRAVKIKFHFEEVTRSPKA